MASLPKAFDMADRVAVVTGAADGIGAAIAEVIAEAGAAVALGDIDQRRAQARADRIIAAGGRAIAVGVDVSSRDEVDTLVDAAVTELGGLDILCNVAGVPSHGGVLADLSEAELDRMIGVNLKGTLFACKAAVPIMTARGGGSIVNTASSIIDIPAAGNGVYAMTKAAITMMSMVLADEVGPAGIRVNVIAPGPTVTDFARHNATDESGRFDEERFAGYVSRMKQLSPLGLIGEPNDQAHLVLYLVSPAGRYATGNVFRVNGGMARPW